jgi:hypothetical protein
MKIGKLNINPKDLELKHWTNFSIEPIGGKNALETMRRGCWVLEKVGIKYWISSGNLLGLYRDGKLIPHDTDIDVNVTLKFNTLEGNNLSKQIILGMTANQFVVIRSIVYKNHFMQLAFMDIVTKVIFDICFFYTGIKPFYAIYLDPTGYIEKPIKYISKLGTLTYDRVDYPIPNKVEEFLTWKYGQDWRTPKTKKVAWQEESPTLKPWKK